MGGDLKAAPTGKAPRLPGARGARRRRRQSRPRAGHQGLARRRRQDAREGLRRGLVGRPQARRQNGKLPPVGNTVNVKEASYSNTIGAPYLHAYWKDPAFDAEAARLLLRARDRDPDAALDHLRRQVLRHQAAGRTRRRRSRSAPTPRRSGTRRAEDMAARWWREPILHFLLIGGLLFWVYGRLAPMDNGGERIVVTQAMVDELAQQHQARWMRPATEQELANLVDAHVRDEIMYREGLTLGLDRDDPVIKRRVRQKLDVDVRGATGRCRTRATPSCRRYLARHAARFTRPAQPELRADLLRRLGHGSPRSNGPSPLRRPRWRAVSTHRRWASPRCCRAAWSCCRWTASSATSAPLSPSA